jgi:hypothetical protein
MNGAMEPVVSMIRSLHESGFWGSLEIQFQGGSVGVLRKIETIKPEKDQQRNNRGEHVISNK